MRDIIQKKVSKAPVRSHLSILLSEVNRTVFDGPVLSKALLYFCALFSPQSITLVLYLLHPLGTVKVNEAFSFLRVQTCKGGMKLRHRRQSN